MLQTQNKEEENIGIDMQIIFNIHVLTKATSHQLAMMTLVRCVASLETLEERVDDSQFL